MVSVYIALASIILYRNSGGPIPKQPSDIRCTILPMDGYYSGICNINQLNALAIYNTMCFMCVSDVWMWGCACFRMYWWEFRKNRLNNASCMYIVCSQLCWHRNCPENWHKAKPTQIWRCEKLDFQSSGGHHCRNVLIQIKPLLSSTHLKQIFVTAHRMEYITIASTYTEKTVIIIWLRWYEKCVFQTILSLSVDVLRYVDGSADHRHCTSKA